jgi:hypothetical protein
MEVVMAAFAVGLFAGGGKLRGLPMDDLAAPRSDFEFFYRRVSHR